ncbi:hypothetical protein [Roseobacter sp. MH60115]|nr:hypothetical protein [Roseobacter sp. MH60115]
MWDIRYASSTTLANRMIGLGDMAHARGAVLQEGGGQKVNQIDIHR